MRWTTLLVICLLVPFSLAFTGESASYNSTFEEGAVSASGNASSYAASATQQSTSTSASSTNYEATQSFTTTCLEIWSCSSWSACSSGTQTRTCTDGNACGTTGSQPATSRSCGTTSSGGSGGGGGSGGSLSSFVDSPGDESSLKKHLAAGQSMDFLVGEDSHSIRVKQLSADNVTLIIQSDPIEATFVEGESKLFDLDLSGQNDTRVTVHDITLTTALVEVEGISELPVTPEVEEDPVTQPQNAVTGQAIAPPPAAEPASEERPAEIVEEAPSSAGMGSFVYVLLALVVLGLVGCGYAVALSQRGKPATPTTLSYEEQLIAYIDKQLENGFTKEYIRMQLVGKGWNADIVDGKLFPEIVQLRAFIAHQRDMHLEDDAIRSKLEVAGWSDALINESMSK